MLLCTCPPRMLRMPHRPAPCNRHCTCNLSHCCSLELISSRTGTQRKCCCSLPPPPPSTWLQRKRHRHPFHSIPCTCLLRTPCKLSRLFPHTLRYTQLTRSGELKREQKRKRECPVFAICSGSVAPRRDRVFSSAMQVRPSRARPCAAQGLDGKMHPAVRRLRGGKKKTIERDWIIYPTANLQK